jgi:hypothetical protein
VAIDDARAVLVALADPETLYVFGVIAARTSMLGLSASDRTGSTPYVTPFGVMREPRCRGMRSRWRASV